MTVATLEVAMRMNDATAAGSDEPSRSPHAPSLALLGGFDLRCHGDPVPLAAPAQRLLALLALSPSRLDREHVAEQLWPALPPERGRGNLRNALWRLRHGCPAVVLEVSLHLELASGVRVDVQELTRLAHRLDGTPESRVALVDVDARRLLVDLLPGWQEEWLAVERDRLHAVALHTLEQLALQRSSAGRVVEALDAAHLAVRADPLRESAVSTLIQVHLAQGNRIEALRVYMAFCERARRELGIAVRPMPQVQQYLAEAFRSSDAGDLSLFDPRPDEAT